MVYAPEALDHLTLIKISGDDKKTFLQGQLTNDINKLDSSWQYSGYCNPKGRLLALFTLWEYDDEIYGLIDSSLLQSTLKRLRMYVMRSKVNIDVLEKTNFIGCFNFESVQKLFPETSINEHANERFVTHIEHSFILKIGRRYLVVRSPSQKSPLPKNVNWLNQEVIEGTPYIGEHSTEMFIPQMVNLDLADGINFKKGCYTGQEIIARLQYLGNLKQRMFVCNVDGNEGTKITIGQKIYADNESKKPVGHIVLADTDSKMILAVVKLDATDDELFINACTKVEVSTKQPYDLVN